MSIEISLLSSIVSAIAGLTGFQHLINEIFDYVLKNKNNEKIAIDYIKSFPNSNRLSHIADLVEKRSNDISKFVLVTQEIPIEKQLVVFKGYSNISKLKVNGLELMTSQLTLVQFFAGI